MAPSQPRVPSVDAGLLSSALFLFREYLAQTAADNPVADEDEEAQGFDIDTRAVLDLFADELGTNVQTTLALYLRVTALYRLLAQAPSLAELAIDPDEPDAVFTENALVAAARLDVAVSQKGEERTADFDARQFREALETDAGT
ncbi:MAG TPA: hypothetical protein VG328_12805 [Stellaceae bacterium]|jgi:hypothetical protein|nr:hypothetical protein [Stellaceae bacterium]